MPGVKTGSSTTASKQKVPKILHPLATPGYIIILNFISACVFNILVFLVTHSFIIIAIPISLVVKFVQKLAVFVRIKIQGATAESSNACETFWFLTTREDQRPSLILLLTVKGRVTSERLEYLVQNRFTCDSEDENEQRTPLQRLSQTPKRIFRELVWLDDNIHRSKFVSQIDIETSCLFTTELKVINLEAFSNEWDVYLYTSNENVTDNAIIVLQFNHCIADIHTMLYAMSGSFLDRQMPVFREEISPAQSCCLGLLTLFAGPSIFVKSLLKSKDDTFAEPLPNGQKRAIHYSQPVSRSDVEIVITATGSSATDVILSCLAGSLRSCLKQHGVLFPDDVNVYYPMNLESSNSLRCFTSYNIVSLPVGTEGAIPRLWEIRDRRNHISSFVEAITTKSVMQLAFLILPASLATRLIEYLLNKCSCTLTTIFGHSLGEDFLLDGWPVENIIPIEDRGHGISITVIECKDTYQLAVLAPNASDYVIKPSQLCAEFARETRVLSARLTERARVVRARGQKILNSRRNSVFIVEEDEE